MQVTSADGQAGTSKSHQEEQFILGDDDDELPPYEAAAGSEKVVIKDKGEVEKEEAPKEVGVHYIQPLDTLQGIAMSYNVSVSQDRLLSCSQLTDFGTLTA